MKLNHQFETIDPVLFVSPISILQCKMFEKVELKTLSLYWPASLFQFSTFLQQFWRIFSCKKFMTTLHCIFSQRHDIKCNVKGNCYAFIELKMRVSYVYIPCGSILRNTIYILLLYFLTFSVCSLIILSRFPINAFVYIL